MSERSQKWHVLSLSTCPSPRESLNFSEEMAINKLTYHHLHSKRILLSTVTFTFYFI